MLGLLGLSMNLINMIKLINNFHSELKKLHSLQIEQKQTFQLKALTNQQSVNLRWHHQFQTQTAQAIIAYCNVHLNVFSYVKKELYSTINQSNYVTNLDPLLKKLTTQSSLVSESIASLMKSIPCDHNSSTGLAEAHQLFHNLSELWDQLHSDLLQLTTYSQNEALLFRTAKEIQQLHNKTSGVEDLLKTCSDIQLGSII